ncbi:aminopeptidase N [Acidihalobacter ferrooxydans]|uniref:Aminopeptidase N n=1 Tax=Acidihalobacter ferrooxydans TaxID=1765967 RepID=A0A1P8UEG0_9GAMM|nr:aminopeptidase N [Acidihalobacter ferrooxydans]APZ42210.1 aminopeptidase N [Acidihalobacter ferrooxydans]
MKEASPRTIYLKDYRPPAFLIERTELRFALGEDSTQVESRLRLRRNPAAATPAAPLVLDGEDLELLSVRLDGRDLAPGEWVQDAESLTLANVPDAFVLEIVNRIKPQENTRLEGLYKSSGNFCTQCEAEGFRCMTYYIDRPDVMSVFTTTVVGEQARYPVLLSNGNPVEKGVLDDGQHFVTWHDPHPKPSYLFALVAGNLSCLEDSYKTASGREVALRIYVEPHNIDKCDHAMASLKKAMRWDEQRFGLEYDLDIFMIVAVDDFNMGAMENKGLNVFNSKLLLARPDTATDLDYERIEGVIAHEYFHNWTGNRVTCRDWFQLSLKEGLTVFRDQSFTAEVTAGTVKRIDDVRMLRSRQFVEDAGPMAHPVRPPSYMEINNFYTVTVYEKGAEVVRMYETLLGREGFRRGMDLYFERHDGHAVTTDDFLAAMADANGEDLSQFQRWYEQAGTPRVTVEDAWDAASGRYTLTLRQSCPATPGQPEKRPFLIPVAVGLLDAQGRDMPLRLAAEAQAAGTTRVLRLTEAEQQWVFEGLVERPLPSLNRGFSAPVRVSYPYTETQLAFLAAHDADAFNRWDAGEQLATRVLLGLIADIQAGREPALPERFLTAFAAVLTDAGLEAAVKAEMLMLPSENWLAEQMDVIDPDAIHAARSYARRALAGELEAQWLGLYHTHEVSGEYRFDPRDAGRRRLRNLALSYLAALDGKPMRQLAASQFEQADNMTDSLGALAALMLIDGAEREQALATFYDHWRNDPLVLDKWFALQASAQRPDTLARVEQLMQNPAFSIRTPNRVYSLIGAFAGNPTGFHAADGSGYRFIGAQVETLNALNPQVAARMVGVFTRWRRYDAGRQAQMRAELERLQGLDLSRDVYEIVSKSLQ